MSTSFNWLIVALSILVAIYVSYMVVGICQRIAVSSKRIAFMWTIGGAFSMGMGIWSMHFIGMLAFTLPIPVYYDSVLTATSILPAILASSIALFMVRVKRRSSSLIIAALLMGLGISAMHYIGMAAMGMTPGIIYSTSIVIMSVCIAIAASSAALFLLFHQIDNNQLNHSFKLLSALIMGGAIAGMHYVGMAAASFSIDCISIPGNGINLGRDLLLFIVVLISIFILSSTQILIFIDKKVSENTFYKSVFSATAASGKGLLVIENGKIPFINEALESLFRVKTATPIKLLDLSCTFKQDEFDRFTFWLQQSSGSTEQIYLEEFTLEKDKNPLILSFVLVGFVYRDRVRQLIITDDITEKKHSERALKKLNESLEDRVNERTRELTKANHQLHDSMGALQEAQSELVQSQKMASLGSLVAGISHEINTPLGIGVTSATCIEEEVEALFNKLQTNTMKKSDLEQFLSHIKEGSNILLRNLQRASNLISSFKQVAVDQTVDSFREVNLHDYIDEIIMSMRPKLKKSLIEINNDISKDINLYTNPGAIYQIINNLIENTLLHGVDTDTPGNIWISAEFEDEAISLIFEDSGKGIEDQIKGQIFDPFFTTRRGSGGSGLGLNIVYNQIMTLKGKIEVQNREGGGARFEMLLPRNTGDLTNG